MFYALQWIYLLYLLFKNFLWSHSILPSPPWWYSKKTNEKLYYSTVILHCHITLYHSCTLCMRINCRMVDLSFIKVTFWLYNIVLWSMSLGHMKPASFTLWLSVFMSLNSFCEFPLFTAWKYVYYTMYLCAWII